MYNKYYSFAPFSPPSTTTSASSSTTSSPSASITSFYSLPGAYPIKGDGTHHHTTSSSSSYCAYPSWPRRSSLNTSHPLAAPATTSSSSSYSIGMDDYYLSHHEPVTNYISDDDLFFPDVFSDSDSDYSPAASPRMRPTSTPIGSVHKSVVRDLCSLGAGSGLGTAGAIVESEEDHQATLVPGFQGPTLAERMAMKNVKAAAAAARAGEGQQQQQVRMKRRRRRSSRKSSGGAGEKLSPILEGGE